MWNDISFDLCNVGFACKKNPDISALVGTAATMIFNIFFYKEICLIPLAVLSSAVVCLLSVKSGRTALGYGDSFILSAPAGKLCGFLKTLWTVTLAFRGVGLFS